MSDLKMHVADSHKAENRISSDSLPSDFTSAANGFWLAVYPKDLFTWGWIRPILDRLVQLCGLGQKMSDYWGLYDYSEETEDCYGFISQYSILIVHTICSYVTYKAKFFR